MGDLMEAEDARLRGCSAAALLWDSVDGSARMLPKLARLEAGPTPRSAGYVWLSELEELATQAANAVNRGDNAAAARAARSLRAHANRIPLNS